MGDSTLPKVGLITYDEVIYAGGYYNKSNSSYYLYNGTYTLWTMSPSGLFSTYASVWDISNAGNINYNNISNVNSIRPVINLNAYVLAIGNGEKENYYEIKTN